VLLGRGDGTFGAKTDYPTGVSPAFVAIHDLNGDGNSDLAVANYGEYNSSTVSILLGDGHGGFAPRSDYGAGVGPWSLAIGDVDGDQRPDLAVANYGSSTMSVLINLSPAPPPIVWSFELKPDPLHLNSKAEWVTGLLEPQPPHTLGDVDLASVRLNGILPIAAGTTPKTTDSDHDGLPEWKLRFSRSGLTSTLAPGERVPVVITGLVAGVPFTGVDSIEVKAPKMKTPRSGDVLIAGTPVDVTWDTAEVPFAQSVTLRASFDDGVNWIVEAEGVPNTGSYRWTTPNAASDRVRLQIMTIYTVDETGVVPESEFAVSDPFVITASTGVTITAAEFALRPANPLVGDGSIRFSLVTSAPATLTVFDVAGRRVAMQDVGSLGPGWHSVRLAELPAGVQIIRLSQAGRSLSSRVVVIR
jgi:hypothetical protein